MSHKKNPDMFDKKTYVEDEKKICKKKSFILI